MSGEERSYFFNFDKLSYIRGNKPEGCILCGIRDKNENVINLTLFETDHAIACLNLYPFNPGHSLIFPKKHCLDLNELSQDEVLDIHRATIYLCKVLRETHRAQAFNIGYNMGGIAGASIDHIHQHIIPRYPKEMGIAELLAGRRGLVQSPYDTQEQIIAYIKENPISDLGQP